MTDRISLKVDGVSYEGWEAIRVDRSLAQVSGAFGFKATDIFPGQSEKWYIRMGQECQVYVNDELLITGYVDGVNIDYDAANHTFEVQGRDKTGDLVDCSFDTTDKNEWKDVSVLSIIKELCAPYGVEVTVDPSVASEVKEKVTRSENELTFKINEGESVFEAIHRLISTKAILPVTYGDGKLTLTRRGTTYVHDGLESGKNVLAGSYEASDLDRYSVYIVKAQNVGADTFSLETITHASARYTDSYVRRTRPLVMVMDKIASVAECRDRAEWEARIRAGKSRTLRYDVVGWTQSNGDIWPINQLVLVKDSFLDVEGGYLIEGVFQTFDDTSGRITRLQLVPPETYDLERTVLKIEKSGKSGFDFDPKVVKDFLAK